MYRATFDELYILPHSVYALVARYLASLRLEPSYLSTIDDWQIFHHPGTARYTLGERSFTLWTFRF